MKTVPGNKEGTVFSATVIICLMDSITMSVPVITCLVASITASMAVITQRIVMKINKSKPVQFHIQFFCLLSEINIERSPKYRIANNE